MILTRALRYPFQGRGWTRRLLALTLLQLLPVIGQLMLLGYGLEIVRAVYAGEANLPPIRWLQALGNGLRMILAGLLYCLPILITGAIIGMSTIGLRVNTSSMGTLSLILSPLIAIVGGLLMSRRKQTQTGAAVKPAPKPGSIFAKIVPLFVMILAIFVLQAVVSGANFSRPNAAAIVLYVLLTLLISVIGLGLGLGGVRQAIMQQGLFSPTTSITLLLQHSATTSILILNLFLLGIITLLVSSLGLILLVLPGLFTIVVGSLAMWYLFAHYGMQIGITPINSTTTSNNVSFSETPTAV
ncbi:DUF4013 domain-containing protein [Tengunoibacter tsumagoiensis]|uniref:DUF4013 domain-containing protein n=1 Tax=Tengunoibacter tsumagoiensis TaxID=2014871 RepID=A0A402A899_9CHLR|nr:DUF4013 domain-containing protein [Tengunoibacter tsumagoiensis]GCE15373.1 hypothetical protein KTT_52320 [Tengunoibacter tsumagoiensis]